MTQEDAQNEHDQQDAADHEPDEEEGESRRTTPAIIRMAARMPTAIGTVPSTFMSPGITLTSG